MFLPAIVTIFTIILICISCLALIVIIPVKNGITLRMEGDRTLASDNVIGFIAAKRASSFRKDIKLGHAFHLFTDARGARVNSARQNTFDKVTIMTIGCSMSWGQGVENEATYTAILGQRLDVPVANFAMGGYGTLQSLLMLERNLDLAPKIIIYGVIEDHMRRNLSPCAPAYLPFCMATPYVDFDSEEKPYIHAPHMEFPIEMTQQFLEDVVFNSLVVNDILWGAKIIWLKYAQKKLLSYPRTQEAKQKSMTFLMRKMSESAKKINAILIVVYMPRLERGAAKPAPSELMSSLTKDTVFVDLSSVIKSYYNNPENPDLELKNDGHPNQLAHRLIANELEKLIRSKYSDRLVR